MFRLLQPGLLQPQVGHIESINSNKIQSSNQLKLILNKVDKVDKVDKDQVGEVDKVEQSVKTNPEQKNTMNFLRILLLPSLLLLFFVISSSSAGPFLAIVAWDLISKLTKRHFEAHVRECTGENNVGIDECEDCCKECVENALEASIEASTSHCWKECRIINYATRCSIH